MIILQVSEIPELRVSEMKLGGLKVSNAVTIQLYSWLSCCPDCQSSHLDNKKLTDRKTIKT